MAQALYCLDDGEGTIQADAIQVGCHIVESKKTWRTRRVRPCWLPDCFTEKMSSWMIQCDSFNVMRHHRTIEPKHFSCGSEANARLRDAMMILESPVPTDLPLTCTSVFFFWGWLNQMNIIERRAAARGAHSSCGDQRHVRCGRTGRVWLVGFDHGKVPNMPLTWVPSWKTKHEHDRFFRSELKKSLLWPAARLVQGQMQSSLLHEQSLKPTST